MSTRHIAVKSAATEHGSGKLGLLPLVALDVGSMIGGGVFSLPQNMAELTVAWRSLNYPNAT